MMPNAWFYKLKDMGNKRKKSSPTTTQTTITSTKFQQHHPKNIYIYPTFPESGIRFTDPLYNSPRRVYSRPSSNARSFARPTKNSSSSPTINKNTTVYNQKNYNSFSSVIDQPIYYSVSSSEHGTPKANDRSRESLEFEGELLMFDEVGSWSSSSCSGCCRISSSTADIIIDLNHHNHYNYQAQKQNDEESSSFSRKFQKLNEFDAALSELELRPILTKIPKEALFNKIDHNSKNDKEVKSRRRSSLSDSFAIIKSSIDPQRDFKDSMMEMIQENNIRGFKDLEQLLACYLSLNCKEYHPLIVDAFEQIWLDLF